MVVALALTWASFAEAADVRGSARLWAGPGYDTNARRDFVSAGVPTSGDGFFYGLGVLEGRVDFERAHLLASYDVAGRKFVTQPSEDTIVQNLQLDGTVALGKSFSAGLSGRARDRRGADRDYSDLFGQGVVAFTPDEALDVRLTAAAHRFVYWPRFAYSYFGPEFGLQARYRFDRRHSASAFGTLGLRTYNALTHADPNNPTPPTAVTRADSMVLAGAAYSYRGPFHLTVAYSYFEQASNSFGETLRRHRVAVTAGVRLPWRLMLFASGAVQLNQFPDGVYLSPDLQVLEDDENSTALTTKLVRPLTDHIDLDLRYALYFNTLPQNNFLYLRQVVSLGASVSF